MEELQRDREPGMNNIRDEIGKFIMLSKKEPPSYGFVS